jgi:hypothetical protein
MHASTVKLVLAGLSFLLIAACSTQSKTMTAPIPTQPKFQLVGNTKFAAINAASSDFAKDRLAILALQGEYQANFYFKETVALAKDYQAVPEKIDVAFETVVLVSQSESLISLQHLLVTSSGMVIKHWREDWIYQADKRMEFSAAQTWRIRDIKPELRIGHWTQCVYEVSDAPRYCGTGKFNHKYGVSTWTSDRTWRPLPRRDYTKRSDYNAINAENRITVTPAGWTHEQDNSKTIRTGEATTSMLTREFGFNDYRSVQGFNFQPAYDYWQRTSPFWAKVRTHWQQRAQQTGVVILPGALTDTSLMQALDELAVAEKSATELDISMLIDRHSYVQ